jgi:hypothetical protein
MVTPIPVIILKSLPKQFETEKLMLLSLRPAEFAAEVFDEM